MKIKVNEKTYNDSTWQYNERGEACLLIKTDESIGEIASTFDGNDVIRAFDDGNEETGRWFVHTLVGIYENPASHATETREVIVSMKITTLTDNAEAKINNSIEENTDAVIEIAGMVADMEDVNLEINQIKATLDGIPKNIVDMIDNINNTYNTLADRVARLENK